MNNATTVTVQDILNFWFVESTPKNWFQKDVAFDALIAERFAGTHTQAATGEMWHWRDTAEG